MEQRVVTLHRGRVYTPSPTRTLSAACPSAAAQSEEIFGFLPVVACVAFATAPLRAVLARICSFRAFLGGLVAAWPMRFSAKLNFLVTLAGTAWPAHAGAMRAAPKVQRAVVQGSVVVVVGSGSVGVVVEVVA